MSAPSELGLETADGEGDREEVDCVAGPREPAERMGCGLCTTAGVVGAGQEKEGGGVSKDREGGARRGGVEETAKQGRGREALTQTRKGPTGSM